MNEQLGLHPAYQHIADLRHEADAERLASRIRSAGGVSRFAALGRRFGSVARFATLPW